MKNNRLKQFILAIGIACLLLPLGDVEARSSSGKTGSHSSHLAHSSYSVKTYRAGKTTSYSYHSSTSSGTSHSTKATSGVARDSHGKIARSSSAKSGFRRSHPCPSTGKKSGSCPGYVIDHRVALKRGGADSPSNMQWQTKEAARDKDKWE